MALLIDRAPRPASRKSARPAERSAACAGCAIRGARSAAMTVVCMPFGLGAGPAGRIALWRLFEAIAVLA